MKLSSALVVSMTTAASAAMAVEDATATAVNQKHGRHIGYNQDYHQKHLHLHQNQNPNASTQVQESLQGLEEATTAAVKSDLLFIKEHSISMGSRTTTTNSSGSGDGVTGDVDVDVGLLPITERSLNSVKEDCTLCTSSTVITASGDDFRNLVSSCYAEVYPYSACQDNVPIGCWNTSEVTDMRFAFDGKASSNESINCWNTAHVTDMAFMFKVASNFNQPLDDWNLASVKDMYGMFGEAANFNQPLDDWNVASVTKMSMMFFSATNFNQPLDDWNVASVTDMGSMFLKATNFNQCLSSWAYKTPPDISVKNLFKKSGCPNKVAVATVGPWCQGEDDEQCFAPSATPSDFPSFLPTDLPSNAPTVIPTTSPTTNPSTIPTISPTKQTDEPTATRPTTSLKNNQTKKSKKSKK